ncbi:MAG: hypothetical protein ACJ8DP_04905, partial [Microvirga sp.]
MAEIDPFESMRALASLWGQGGNAFLASQQGMFRDMAENMAEKMRAASEGGAAAAGADTAGFEAARQAFGELWSSATAVSANLSKAMQGSAPPDPLVAEMLAKIFDPKAWFSGT